MSTYATNCEEINELWKTIDSKMDFALESAKDKIYDMCRELCTRYIYDGSLPQSPSEPELNDYPQRMYRALKRIRKLADNFKDSSEIIQYCDKLLLIGEDYNKVLEQINNTNPKGHRKAIKEASKANEELYNKWGELLIEFLNYILSFKFLEV